MAASGKIIEHPLTEAVRWGEAGAPLLPRSLKKAFAGQPLPRWLLEEAGLPEGATAGALGSELWEAGLAGMTHRIELYACRLLEARLSDVRHLAALGRPWPLDLDPGTVPWTRRTRNCLLRSGLGDNPLRLSQLTYGDLLAMPQMGPRSVLDFAVTAEMAIDRIERGQHIPDELTELARKVLRAPWAEFISGEDPRFSDLLPNDSRTLADRLDEIQLSSEAIATAEEGHALALVLPSIVERITRIEESPLDVALHEYVAALSGLQGARLDALLQRFGFDGRPPRTLQYAADVMGVTRERVRQIQTRVTEKRPSHPIFLPALDRALQLVTEIAPAGSNETARQLQTDGVARAPFHPASVLAAAQFCGRSETFEIEPTPKGDRVVTSPMLASAAQITLLASRQSDSFGASNLAELISALKDQEVEVSEEQAREVLRLYSNTVFLNDDWFWVPNKSSNRNRLHNVTRKILSVVSPLDVTTIRDGTRRSYRFREVTLLPPRGVMTAFFEAHPAFAVEPDTRVRTVDPLDYRAELGKTEQIFVEVLRSSPTGVLDRASLEDACEARGMNANTFSVYSTYSPVLEHLGTDVWALRGVQVNPAAVNALRQANALKPRERLVADYGWNDEGALWVAVRVPRRYGSFVIGLPSPIAHYVAERRFAARADDGSAAGTIAVNEVGTSWGYGPFLARRGADEGDVLLIAFDLAAGEVVLRLGDLHLVEDA
jgi:Sigma-70, region 4